MEKSIKAAWRSVTGGRDLRVEQWNVLPAKRWSGSAPGHPSSGRGSRRPTGHEVVGRRRGALAGTHASALSPRRSSPGAFSPAQASTGCAEPHRYP